MDEKDPLVRLRNLVKTFGPVKAVDEVSLDISRGEFITLLGPSGSGKTTTLMMVAGFEDPDQGEIYIDGQPMANKPPYRRGIGMVFQNYALFPHMTVNENIAYPLNNRKVQKSEIHKRVNSILDLVKLGGLGNRYPKQLSGGQQQRVALARALVFNPSVLLMDEPLGALDKKLREHMQLEIKRIQETLQITILYVTHDQSEALTMSDRIALMNEGRIVQVGSPNELYEDPANSFVADFIGESNFLEGEVVGLTDHGHLVRGKRSLPFYVRTNRPLTNGATIRVALRPEKIFFLDSGEPAKNQIDGMVEAVVYVGDFTKYEIQIDGMEQPLTLKQQNRLSTIQYLRGSSVRIGWNAEDGKVV